MWVQAEGLLEGGGGELLEKVRWLAYIRGDVAGGNSA